MIDDRMLEEELDKYVHHSFPEMVAASRKKTGTFLEILLFSMYY